MIPRSDFGGFICWNINNHVKEGFVMGKLNIQLCPETGICSVIKADGSKIDMIPSEVDQLRQAEGDSAQLSEILSQVDSGFSSGLDAEDIEQISNDIK